MEDETLLKNLRKNSRASITRLANGSRNGYQRFKNIQEYIKKFTTIVDFTKLGYPIRVVFLLNTRGIDQIDMRPVNNMAKITGKHNFMMECIFKSNEEETRYEKTLQSHNPEKYYVVNEACYEEFLAR